MFSSHRSCLWVSRMKAVTGGPYRAINSHSVPARTDGGLPRHDQDMKKTPVGRLRFDL